MTKIKPNQYKYFVLAWLFPGLGHLLLGFKKKACIISAIIVFMIIYGLFLQGQIYSVNDTQELFKWGSLIEVGMGPIYFILAALPLHEGVVKTFTFEYGTSFIFAGAILNYFAIIDIADILLGRHENNK
jgi:hypothetical protein